MSHSEYIQVDGDKWKKRNAKNQWVYYKKLQCCVCGVELFRRYYDFVRNPNIQSVCKSKDCKSKLWSDKLGKEYEVGKEYVVDENTIRIWSGKSWTYKSSTKCVNCGSIVYRDRPTKNTNNFCSDKCKYIYSDLKGSNILLLKDTPKFCYLMGLIATDGNIHNKQSTITISLTLHDYGLLKELRDIFGGYCYVHIYSDVFMYEWKINSLAFKEYAESIGLTSNKSKTLDMTLYFDELSNENKWHFIRGVMDGDGSIGLVNNKHISIGFTSGSECFCKMIHKFCCESNSSKSNICIHDRVDSDIYYSFAFSHNKAIPIISNLYKNKESSFYLHRKYNKCHQLLGDDFVYYKEEFFKNYNDVNSIFEYKGCDIYLPDSNKAFLIDIGLSTEEKQKIKSRYSDNNIDISFLSNKCSRIDTVYNCCLDEILVWDGHELTNDYITSISMDKKKAIIADLFDFFKNYNWDRINYNGLDISSEFQKIKESNVDIVVENGVKCLSNSSYTGGKIYRHFFPNILKIRSDNGLSVYDALNDDAALLKIIHNRVICYPMNITAAMIVQGAKASGTASTGSIFKPAVAKSIYKEYVKDGYNVYDYSAGFGGRLLGLMSLGYDNVKYFACEPNTETYNNLINMSMHFGFNTQIVNKPSEDVIFDEKMDFVFSSPPYFNKEVYTDEDTQCYNRYPDYNDWLLKYWGATVSNIKQMLASNGTFGVNIGNSSNDFMKKLTDDVIEVVCSKGFVLKDTIYLKTARSHLTKTDVTNSSCKLEGIYMFQNN